MSENLEASHSQDDARQPRNRLSRVGLAILLVIIFLLVVSITLAVAVGLLKKAVQEKVDPILSRANKTQVESDLRAIYDTAEMVHAMTGAYPDSIDAMIVSVDDGGEEAIGLEERPKDPWGNDYLYEIRKGEPHITCLGRDGLPGGEGDDADYAYPEPTP